MCSGLVIGDMGAKLACCVPKNVGKDDNHVKSNTVGPSRDHSSKESADPRGDANGVELSSMLGGRERSESSQSGEAKVSLGTSC